MSNPLLISFPRYAKIDGVKYELNTDFRTCLKIIEAFEDRKLMPFEQQAIMVHLLYKETPHDYEKAIEAGIKFLDCGKENQKESSGRVYSFKKDAEFIYSAFLYTYGVDLQESSMHWWKFCSMFAELDDNTFFERIVGIRQRRNEGKMTKEDRQIWFKIPHILSLEEQEPDPELEAARANFERLMGGVGIG